ncbi:Preprotein translocase subunit SCY2, chloroplastic, partial [Mucuna pruriens]
MEATRFSSNHFHPHCFQTKPNAFRGLRYVECINGIGTRVSLFTIPALRTRNFPSPNRTLSVNFSDRFRSDYVRVEASKNELPDEEVVPETRGGGEAVVALASGADGSGTLQFKPRMFRNRFLNLVRLSSVINGAAESFFKSEIRRRLFVTAVLIVISRVGYFIPLPGFDRRLIPQDYLSFVSGSSVDELGDFTAELKLSLFQLGISPQIIASIIMQVLCHVVPSLVKLRKEGLDGHEKIKSYIWWMSLGFAILEALIVACYSLPYSIYAASYRVKHVMLTTVLLVCGAMTITWICDTISESGFGQGSSLIICVGILTGYMETLYKMLTQLSVSAVSWWPYVLAVLGIFTTVTMWAVVVTEGCRKVKLQYYGFKLASAAREQSPITEVEPYIPFNINPAGMQPVLTTSYLLAFPSILASLLRSPFWENVKEMLNPETSVGAEPWVGSIIELRRSYQAYNVMPSLSNALRRYGSIDLNKETMAKSQLEMDYAEIYTASNTLDGSTIFHTIYDVVGFVLYMHQQIPSTVQDMSVEFEEMHSEYKQLEMALGTEVKPSFRRKHVSKMRDIKVGIRRLDKLMNSLLNMQTAFKIMINEVPTIDGVVLALGASPLRPQHIYVLDFSHAIDVSKVADDFARSKAAETLSRKAIRTLISKGAGSVTYPGPIKLFVLIKAPSSFNQPMHFLPKRDFRYNRKVVPLRLLFKCRNQAQEVAATPSEDLIWYLSQFLKGYDASTGFP